MKEMIIISVLNRREGYLLDGMKKKWGDLNLKEDEKKPKQKRDWVWKIGY